MTTAIERRYLMTAEYPDAITVQTRDGEPPVITGISPPWDSFSVDLGGFREKFAPTAFDGLVDRKANDPRGKIDVPFLTDHISHLITGRTTNGRLELRKALKGLEYIHRPLQTTHGRDLAMLVDDRTITGASFAFTAAPDGETWTEDEKGNVIRTVFRASGLYDISAVTYPAYPQSTAGIRSLPLWKQARSVMAHRSESRGLTISLDFDGTFTAAPGLWRSFVTDAQSRGNRVVCITRRDDTEENRAVLRQAFGDLHDELAGVLLCGRDQQKRSAAAAAGLTVDVWIDDYPEGIPERSATTAEGSRAVKVSTLAGARAAAAAASARMRAALASTEVAK
jgi:HK97 family phage prohead protease